MGQVLVENHPVTVSKAQERVKGYLHRLQRHPPDVLLLEGGSEADRSALGLYWAALLNCKSERPPCLDCATCHQIEAMVFRDVYFFDGSQGSVKIEDVRQIRRMMGEKPEYDGTRCFVFHEAQELTVSAANSLLKSMEEPLANNVFVLLVSLRSRLLSTLVSRSMVLTLNWLAGQPLEDEECLKWEQLLLEFWKTGRGLFAQTGLKQGLDRNMVRGIITHCQRTLLSAMSGQAKTPLERFWVDHSDRLSFGRVERLFNKVLEILSYQTNPVLVFEWFALKIWTWIRD